MTNLSFDPPVIAHRGASAYAPENTLAAFTKAAQLGIKWVEFDVMQAACGELIVFHDESLKRMAGIRQNVIDFPYTYLQTLDVGANFGSAFAGERIPTLRQVLNFLVDNKMHANIEIKANGQIENLVVHILEIISEYQNKTESTFLFSSFSIHTLRLLRKYSQEANIGLLLHRYRTDWDEVFQSLNCVSLHINHSLLTRKLTKQIKNKSEFLLSYTVNQPEKALELFSWGVDAVFSDVPDKICKMI